MDCSKAGASMGGQGTDQRMPSHRLLDLSWTRRTNHRRAERQTPEGLVKENNSYRNSK